MIALAHPPTAPAVPAEDLTSVVSASRLNCFHSCRLKFYFRYVLEIVKPGTAALFVGKAVHAALQEWSVARWRGQPHDVEALKAGFLMNWVTGQEEEPVAWQADEDAQQEKAWGLVEMYLRETPIPDNATPESGSLSGTDLDVYARVTLNGAKWDAFESFLLPLDCLQAVVKRFGPRTILNIEPDRVFCDLGTGRVSEAIESVAVEEFPVEPAFDAKPVAMPESFPQRFIEALGCSSTDATRYILNGALLDVSGAKDASHYIVGTDGRHLFSANSFTIPVPESVTIPNHKLLLWRGLADHPWALAGQKNNDHILVRVTAGDWTLTTKTIDGNYPNWQQVVPHVRDHKTVVTLPEEHQNREGGIASHEKGTLFLPCIVCP